MTWSAEHKDLAEWLSSLEDPHSFLQDMISTLKKKGELSPAQTRATYKWMDGAKKRAEQAAEAAVRLSDAPAVAEGRYDITGEVVSAKWKYTNFGEQLKMVVELADGNKVYGTVPKSIRAITDDLKGKVVRFTATVTRSDNDEHFGFFSKPTNAEVI